MKENYKKMSSVQLMFALISSVDSAAIKYVDGANPFVVNVGEDSVNIYIKNLSPAQLSNNNPDISTVKSPFAEISVIAFVCIPADWLAVDLG